MKGMNDLIYENMLQEGESLPSLEIVRRFFKMERVEEEALRTLHLGL